MGDALSFLGKLLDITARIASAFAITGTIVIVMHHFGVGPVESIPATWWTVVIGLTIFGYSVVAYDVARAWLPSIGEQLVARLEVKARAKEALRNYDSMLPEHSQALRYLKHIDRQRFVANPTNSLIHSLNQAGLIDVDQRNWSMQSRQVYFKVPAPIWDKIEVGQPQPTVPISLVFENPGYWV